MWGGSSAYLLHLLQVIQNRAARQVTRLSWYTTTKTLLGQCGWLSVKQLSVFHSLVLVYKVKSDKKPFYLYDRLGHEFSHNTRLMEGNGVRDTGKQHSELHRTSFIPRSIRDWNSLPHNIRLCTKLPEFKKRLKVWVKSNIEI